MIRIIVESSYRFVRLITELFAYPTYNPLERRVFLTAQREEESG